MIEFEQIAPGIYLYRWEGVLEAQDMYRASEALASQNGKQPFASIVDMRKLEKVPMDIGTMRAVIKTEMRAGLRGYVLLGASRAIESFVRPMAVLAPTTYKFTQDWDEAVSLARGLLQEE